jgi:hypothetical protein
MREAAMPMTAKEILDREYLQIRSNILDIASALDRQDRAVGELTEDRRRQLLERGISILSSGSKDRAAEVQLLFSREYDPAWRKS